MNCLFSLTHVSSELSQDYFPPIELEPDSTYILGLTSFNTHRCILNVVNGVNNMFQYLNREKAVVTIYLLEGSYEITDIGSYINNKIFKKTGEGMALQLTPNTITFKVELQCLYQFMTENSIDSILGFSDGVLNAEMWHKSNLLVQISRVAKINVECNLIDGSYRDGKPCHTIYSFFPNINRRHKINEHPVYPLYFNVSTRTISHISLCVTDQCGNLIDFNGEEICVQLNLKKLL